ncbi:MAG TPA: DUF1801 domain-containing protein [Bacteroidia bacterium]|nr:DUF1801 domain-containing protein [Bacteroidia bacterium]
MKHKLLLKPKNDTTLRRNMQNVSFRDISDFLEFIPENELKIVNVLRTTVLNCLPECTEKLSYQVPFYKIHKNICFIWPASVYWGKTQSYNGVIFGLSYGHLIIDEEAYFEKGKRKFVTMRKFESIEEIDIDKLRSYIFEAALIDEGFKKRK